MVRHLHGTISAGVSQGSILGFLLFLIYINDLTDGLRCNAKLFADNTSIVTVAHDPHTAAVDINHDLNLIKLWAHNWRMSFNPDPDKQAVEVTFSKKRIPMHHPPIFLMMSLKRVSRNKSTLDSYKTPNCPC